jgi:nucleoside-diphosphate-sugar epimerase
MIKKVCITGGAGYVGSQLVPYLINKNYEVTVLDTYWYDDKPFDNSIVNHPNFHYYVGDIRDPNKLQSAFIGQDAVIHLACISNDPSFEMNAGLGKSINYDAFAGILSAVKSCGVKRFIYASSSSVYGVKHVSNVTEDMACEPLTDYSKYKFLCEEELYATDMGEVEWSIIRPATVCGYGKRMRFDLVVNAMTISAIINRKIEVHGGAQMRPNLNIKDMCRAYEHFLRMPKDKIHQKIFNIGGENMTLSQIAECVAKTFDFLKPEIVWQLNADKRSYHVNSDKAWAELDFSPQYSVRDAVDQILLAHTYGLFDDPTTNPKYYNIKRMKELGL